MLSPRHQRERPIKDIVDGVIFTRVQVQPDAIIVSGGFSKQSFAVLTEQFVPPGKTMPIRFFNASNSEPWFSKLVSGGHSMNYLKHHISVFKAIWLKLREHFDGTALADAPTIVDATHQPSSGNTAVSSSTDTVQTTPSAIGHTPVPALALKLLWDRKKLTVL